MTLTLLGAIVALVLGTLALMGATGWDQMRLVEWGLVAISGGVVVDAILGVRWRR